MSLAEFLLQVQATLDGEPAARLAVSLDNLGNADDAHLIGLDLVEGYARTTDPLILTAEPAATVALLRCAIDILAGTSQLHGILCRDGEQISQVGREHP